MFRYGDLLNTLLWLDEEQKNEDYHSQTSEEEDENLQNLKVLQPSWCSCA